MILTIFFASILIALMRGVGFWRSLLYHSRFRIPVWNVLVQFPCYEILFINSEFLNLSLTVAVEREVSFFKISKVHCTYHLHHCPETVYSYKSLPGLWLQESQRGAQGSAFLNQFQGTDILVVHGPNLKKHNSKWHS